jgi:ABC-type nitrate/sulfonate/bicarbonate transport system substrate-binding protein
MKHLRRTALLVTALATTVAIGSFVWVAAPMTQSARTPVSLELVDDFGTSLARVAFAEGIFAKNQLDVTVEDFPEGQAAISALGLKQDSENAFALTSEYATITFTPVIPSIAIISQTSNNDDNFHWITRGGLGIRTVEGLKGKRIGLPLTTGMRVFALSSLSDHHLSAKDVVLVPMDSKNLGEQLTLGNVDAIPSRYPLTSSILRLNAGKAAVLHDKGAYDWFGVVTAKRALLSKRPEIAKSLLKSLAEAAQFAYANPQKARQDVANGLKMDLADVPDDLVTTISLRISSGLLRQLVKDRAQLVSQNGNSPLDYFSDPRGIIDPKVLSSMNPLLVHLD